MTVFVVAGSHMQVLYIWLYLTALMGFNISKHEVSGSFSPNVTKPERGSALRITCSLSGARQQLNIYSYNIQSQPLTQCRLDRKNCQPPFLGNWSNPFYFFGATADTAWVDIISLNRTRDQGVWFCQESNNTKNNETLFLTVYSSPEGVSLLKPLPPIADLAETSVMLQCMTYSCGYPESFIVWYYQKVPNPISLSAGMITRSNSTENCTEQEQIYHSSLELSRGTNFLGNIPMTVNLLCGITHHSPNEIIFSTISNSIIFAVSLMFVNISGETDLTQGVQASFTCITSISRPRATVTWFIGTTEIMSGIQTINSTDGNGSPFVESRLAINPDGIIHHGKEIFCQAITPFNNVTSAKLILNVKVSLMFVNISGETGVTQGVQANFTCITSISRPHATVTWFIGTTEITSGIQTINSTDGNGSPFVESRIAINPDGITHHGKEIFCKAITPFDLKTSAKLILSVRVYVTNVTLNPEESVVIFLDGDEKMMSCTSSAGRPQPIIRWWLNGVLQISGSTEKHSLVGNLHVTTSQIHLTLNKTFQDKQMYCDAQVAGQVYVVNSTRATANIWYMPSKPSVKPFGIKFPWLENRTGILECVTDDHGNPRASVLWMNHRGTINNDEHLVISNLTDQDDQKAVTCKLQNNYTELKGMNIVSPTDIIRVEYTPTVILNPTEQQVRVKEMNPLRIDCRGTGNPNPTVQWVNENPSDNILYFPKIRRNNTGTYTCKASSNSTHYGGVPLHREISVFVIVEYAPDVSVSLFGSSVVNTSANLMCVPMGEPPQYTFQQWVHKVGQTVIRQLNGTNTANYSILPIPIVQFQDMGTYICTVSNTIPGVNDQLNQTSHINVSVQGPPFIGEMESTFTGEINSSANITIPFYSSSADISMKFTRQLTEIVNTSATVSYILTSDVIMIFKTKEVKIPGHAAVLHFRNLTDKDFDSYTIQLSNDHGNTFKHVFFIASGPPSVPKMFVFSHFKEGLPVFEIEKGFNGGHTQTFIFEYQPDGNPEAHWTTLLEISESNLMDPSLNRTHLIQMPGLPNGHYKFRVYAKNAKGNSTFTKNISLKIERDTYATPFREFPVAAVTGGIVAAVIVVIAVAVALVVFKRRNHGHKGKDCGAEEIEACSGNHQDTGLVDNPVYVTSGLAPLATIGSAEDEYAKVGKAKKRTVPVEDQSDLYAQVDKTKTNKLKKGDTSANVYENSKYVGVGTSGENVYENPGDSASNGPLVFKDGLLYADLMLNPPATINGKPVIWGLENRTEYAQIEYGLKGQPLPDNDKK